MKGVKALIDYGPFEKDDQNPHCRYSRRYTGTWVNITNLSINGLWISLPVLVRLVNKAEVALPFRLR